MGGKGLVKRAFVIVSLGLSALGSAGCGSVKPYQRGTLAHPAMRTDSRPEEGKAEQHMLGARESSQGGTGEAGGGCGCN